MSKYTFNATRCKEAIEGLSKMVYDKGYGNIPEKSAVLLGVILDDLILDIEDLHRKAQERDRILESLLTVADKPHGEYDRCAMEGDLIRLYHEYTNEEGKLEETEDLSL